MTRSARSVSLRTFALLLLLPLAGCIAAGHTSSPWEFGGGLRVAPALWTAGASGVTVHPALGYTYLSFDGGHDGLWEVGGQVRKPVGAGARPFWIGGEATFSRLTSTYTLGGSSISGSTNGVSATALFGVPVGESRWGPSLFGGVGISDYGSQGWNVRVGVDLQPRFLWER